jgi:predicted nucleic acid-binding protein
VPARLRAVLDTQIIVRRMARLHPTSAAVQIFDRARRGDFTAVSSAPLLGEVRQVLRIASALTRWTDDEVRKAVDHVAKSWEVVPGRVQDVRQIVRKDLNDNPLFEAALEADVGYVVTDDLAVLNVKRIEFSGFRPIEVIAPGPFLKILGAARTAR